MLSNKALLVSLNISQCVFRKLDKRATETVVQTHATEHAVGNYTKKLLPGAKELDNIQRIAGNIRVFFYEQTLPWCADGSRIISSKNFLDFTSAFHSKRVEFEQAVAEFINAYPTLKEQARAKLGDLFNPLDYPSELYLKNMFNCQVNFMPMPDVADFRVEITDQERDTFLKTMHTVESNALKECYQRMHDLVSKAALKLQEPDAIIRESLIGNIQDLCSLMPKLNVNDDADLEATRVEVENIVKGISVAEVREIGVKRNEAATALSNAMSKMNSFMNQGAA